jgi:hypothetical protein
MDNLQVKKKAKWAYCLLYVLPDANSPVIGRDTINKMGLIFEDI